MSKSSILLETSPFEVDGGHVIGRDPRKIPAHEFQGAQSVLIDMVGRRVGRLTIIARVENNRGGQARWLSRCDCGGETVSIGAALRNGATRSCGCLGRERVKGANALRIKHGCARRGGSTPEYLSWTAMIQRCENPNAEKFPEYGGRGITICDRWRQSFGDFLADMGEKLPGQTLDRIEVNGNYEPSNCRWADAVTQANNRRPRRSVNISDEERERRRERLKARKEAADAA
jgi:hypothetical protein